MPELHLLYMSDNKRVCQEPDRLATDAVVWSAGSGKLVTRCSSCMTYLMRSNEKAYQEELAKPQIYAKLDVPHGKRRRKKQLDETWLMHPITITSFFWLSVFLLIWAVFIRG